MATRQECVQQAIVRREALPGGDMAVRLQAFLEEALDQFPNEIVITDWNGHSYTLGLKQPHWRGIPLEVRLKTKDAGRDLLALDAMAFLDRFVAGDVDMTGNIYALAAIRDTMKLALPWWKLLLRIIGGRTYRFQDSSRARVNVKSHYDIPQEALQLYLDRVYMAYSCGMFESPELTVDELTRIGRGQSDGFDSLEKAQWRKYKDAADFASPEKGEALLDVGCGYAGQLRVALENHPFGKVVGWTHSHNQVVEGRKGLASFDPARWELHEGDYRQECRVFDHITSTGMISHVGPRGLVPYVREIRRRIRKHGRYLHHALMTPHNDRPLDAEVGVAFNKKYVWPGFHWFTLGEHVRALEENGFEVTRVVNLSPSYAKTTAAWYERMMAGRQIIREHLDEATFRAWQVYLAATSQGFFQGSVHVYRVYTRAV
jgi:cyclopropane fatty-acyl-phospholipid synthase-like methyltransferase